jgi:hypothetical protein
MNFQNSYILTFNQRFSAKNFTVALLSILLLGLLLSFLLNRLNITITGNDNIKNYQLAKIKDKSFNSVATIIVGDSSGGNAIDAQYFQKLSGLPVRNLCLTGGYGISGSLGMVQKAYRKNNNLKNIIIVHSFGVWQGEISTNAILELFPLHVAYQELGLKPLINFLFNPKELWWHTKYLGKQLLGKKFGWEVDHKNDYIQQSNQKYSNNLKTIQHDTAYHPYKISYKRLEQFNKLQKFCQDKKLNCIFAYGPTHSVAANNSQNFFQLLNQTINNKIQISYIRQIYSYENRFIGDSLNHIDTTYKQQVTRDYFHTMNTLLVK